MPTSKEKEVDIQDRLESIKNQLKDIQYWAGATLRDIRLIEEEIAGL